MRSKRRIGIIVLVLVVAVGGVAAVRHRRNSDQKPIIHTVKVTRGTVTTSVSANGTLQAPHTVEVKSNVGGEVIQLTVDEGDAVKAGQLIARIDSRDPLSGLQQAQADYKGALSRVQQATQDQAMQKLQTEANIRAATEAVNAATQRMAQAETQAEIQPQLTDAAIKQAESNLAAAQSSRDQTKAALTPQKLSAAQAGYDQAQAGYDQAEKELTRQHALLAQGYVAQSQVDAAQQQRDSAKAQLAGAKSKWDTVKGETDQDLRSAQARVDQAQAALDTALANRVQDGLKKQDVEAARASLKQAQASLDSANAGAYQERMKREALVQAQAQADRSKATVQNAQTQVDYTTIVSPCDGVVVKKYVEAGGIVTAGRSSIGGSGAGVAIVDIADVTQMQVLVNLDETDIAQIKVGQPVDITIDAYPDDKFQGTVAKIAPQAVVDQNVTTVPVTVDVAPTGRVLKPAMNAICNFVIERKDNVLVVPSEAVKETGQGTTVSILENGKQVTRTVTVGLAGNDSSEITSGLGEGEEVVTAVLQPSKTPAATPPGSQGSRGSSGGPPPGMGPMGGMR